MAEGAAILNSSWLTDKELETTMLLVFGGLLAVGKLDFHWTGT